MSMLPSSFTTYRDRVQTALETFVPASDGPVERAMRYTLLAPSKRVRAVVVLLAAEVCGGDSAEALAAAGAVEAVHAASLILDDLPCMDNASLRRGQPTAHMAHGEAVAVLAAFALLNQAYAQLASAYAAPVARRLSTVLADAVGIDGLTAGQAEDVLAADTAIDFDTLERIHRRKTGVLFSAAATAGAVTAGGSATQIASLEAYAKNLGLAFQIVDDLLDVVGTPEETGKATKADAKRTTFVAFSGVEGARKLAEELCGVAAAALAPFGRRAEKLVDLSDFVAGRRG